MTMGGLAERIYLASPIWAQQAIVATYGWWWYRRRYGLHFHHLAAEFRTREGWTTKQFCAYQERQLAEILAAAWRSSYYRQLVINADIKPSMEPFEVLSRLPFLTKETIRTHAKDLLTQNPLPRRTIIFKSSGT